MRLFIPGSILPDEVRTYVDDAAAMQPVEAYSGGGQHTMTVTAPDRQAATRRKRHAQSAREIIADEVRSAKRLTARLAVLRRDSVRELLAGAEIAFAEALRNAGIRAITKTRNKKGRAAAATVASAFDRHESLVPFFAALGVTESDLLAGAFQSYGTQAQAWLEQRRRQERQIIREERGPDDEDMSGGDENTDALGAAFIVAALLALARQRILSGNEPTDTEPGEVSGAIPAGIITRGLSVASGMAVPTFGETADQIPTLHAAIGARSIEAAIADGLRDRLTEHLTGELRMRRADDPNADVTSITNALDQLNQPEPTMTEYRWVHGFYGEPKTIFEPHEQLGANEFTTTDPEQDEALRNDGSWPETEFFQPGDHLGCTCEWVAQVHSAVDSLVQAVA